MSTKSITVVHDDDVEDLLKSIGEYHHVMAGNARCSLCDRRIGISDIHTIYPDSGGVKYVCNDPACILRFGNR
jgi:hypothetical protein